MPFDDAVLVLVNSKNCYSNVVGRENEDNYMRCLAFHMHIRRGCMQERRSICNLSLQLVRREQEHAMFPPEVCTFVNLC
jgi:hypothetical protein